MRRNRTVSRVGGHLYAGTFTSNDADDSGSDLEDSDDEDYGDFSSSTLMTSAEIKPKNMPRYAVDQRIKMGIVRDDHRPDLFSGSEHVRRHLDFGTPGDVIRADNTASTKTLLLSTTRQLRKYKIQQHRPMFGERTRQRGQ